MTTYYVDNALPGSDSNNGTSRATPFRTLSHAVSVLTAGDVLEVVDGCVFRGENITCQSSGAEGSPITVRRSGDGVAPLLTGAAVIANGDFAEYEVTDQPVFTQTLTANVADGGVPRNYRCVVTLSGTATAVKIRLRAATTVGTNWTINGCAIGPQVSTHDATAMTRITFNSGSNSVVIPGGSYADSDWITFPVTTGSYLVHIFFANRWMRQTTGTCYYDNINSDETLVATPSGAQLTGSVSSSFVETVWGLGNDITLYRKDQTDAVELLWEDDLFLTEAASVEACVTAGRWFWDGADYLYVHASDSSAVPTNGKVYEIQDQVYSIFTNAKSWWDISGVNCTKTWGAGTLMGGIYLTGSNHVVHDLTTWNHGRHCFFFYVGCTDSLGYNLEIGDCVNTTPFGFFGTGNARNELRSSHVYNSQVNCASGGLMVAHGAATDGIVDDVHFDMANGANILSILGYDAGTDGFTIRHCIISYTASAITGLGQAQSGIYFADADNWTIEDNRLDLRECGTLVLAGVRAADCSGWTIRRNNIMLPTGATTKYALLLVNTTSTSFTANIVSATLAMSVDANSQSGFSSNINTFCDNGSFSSKWGTTSYTTLATWRTASSQDANSWEVAEFKNTNFCPWMVAA